MTKLTTTLLYRQFLSDSYSLKKKLLLDGILRLNHFEVHVFDERIEIRQLTELMKMCCDDHLNGGVQFRIRYSFRQNNNTLVVWKCMSKSEASTNDSARKTCSETAQAIANPSSDEVPIGNNMP